MAEWFKDKFNRIWAWSVDKGKWILIGTVTAASSANLMLSPGDQLFSLSPCPYVSQAERLTVNNVRGLLTDHSAKERAQIKGCEIAQRLTDLPRTNVKFSGADFDIEIRDLKEIEGGIEFYARAWKPTGEPVGFGKDGSVEWERFRIFNPPILVNDPLGNVIRTHTREDGTIVETRLREDPIEAIKQVVAHNIKLVGKDGSNIIKGKTGNTISTFYPDPDPENTSVDGWARRYQYGATWTQIRNGAGTEADDTQAEPEPLFTWSGVNSNTWDYWSRVFILFDTSLLPDEDTIDSATLSVYGYYKYNDFDSWIPEIGITSSNPASNTQIVADDYDVNNFGSIDFATRISYDNFSTSTYNDFTFNTDGINNIDKSGVSKFGVRFGKDIDNTEPPWSSHRYARMSFNHADEIGTVKDPKLVVRHGGATNKKKLIISEK